MDSTIKPEIEPMHIDDINTKPQPEVLDPKAERRVLRKCDLHVVPVLMLLYLLAFLDRINIGNARLQGLERDLGMEGNDYNLALFIFFIPYILCEIPCNLIMKRLAPSTWLSSIMAFWGIITICQGFVQNNGGLMACRFLIGVFEAGFLPGCVYLISMYYKRYELQWRLTLFFTSSILAGAVSGLLAYGMSYMDGVRGYSSWRWIFILEGIATVVVAVIAKFFIVDWPDKARFLNDAERAILQARLQSDQGTYRMDRLDKTAIKRIATDVKIYLGTIMYLGVLNTGYAASFFTPTILNEMGWSELDAQVMSVPVYIVAAVLTLCMAILSDRLRHRFGFAMVGCLVATVGYSILLAQDSVTTGVKYFALFAVVGGGYIAQPILIGWLSNNMSGHYKQAIASAVQIGFGNCGGFVASNIFIKSESPHYRSGYGTSLGLIWVCALASIVMFAMLVRENRKREKGERDCVLQLDQREVENLGDGHPHFRYTY
ncbi:major facilitator superfamily domain-containing protein [Aspergillus karnatakaensis]|uniref:major facilitator superfamily domain-containing protein n=1 Tax=Aspergillus karnatakaensis TaxID=1810916 RepID=UPI003CCDE928